MRIALYARVSTSRQAQAQTIEQQLERLHAHLASQGEVQGEAVDEHTIFRDAGYSGASLSRPGLDQDSTSCVTGQRWPSSTAWW
jgi:site-specific DNA recombinase